MKLMKELVITLGILVLFLGLVGVGSYSYDYFMLDYEWCHPRNETCLTLTTYEMDQIKDNPLKAFKHAFNGNLKINGKLPKDIEPEEMLEIIKNRR